MKFRVRGPRGRGRGRRGGQDAKGGATRRKGSGGGGGLLHIGSELLSNVIQSIVEPQRREGKFTACRNPTMRERKVWPLLMSHLFISLPYTTHVFNLPTHNQ